MCILSCIVAASQSWASEDGPGRLSSWPLQSVQLNLIGAQCFRLVFFLQNPNHSEPMEDCDPTYKQWCMCRFYQQIWEGWWCIVWMEWRGSPLTLKPCADRLGPAASGNWLLSPGWTWVFQQIIFGVKCSTISWPVKVGVLLKIFRFLEIHITEWTGLRRCSL